MFGLIAVLLPSLLGLKLMDYLLKGINLKNLIFYYGILILLSQAIGNIIIPNILDIDKSLWQSLNIGTDFFSIYILILIITNILLALIIVVLKKNIKIEIEVEYEEKNKCSKNKNAKNESLDKRKKAKNNKTLLTKNKKDSKQNKNK